MTEASLSGRLTTLEGQVAFFSQDLLQKIDTVTLSQSNIVWNQQYNTIYDAITAVQTSLQYLQTLVVNLNYTVSAHYATFTGHTGNTGIHV